METILLILLIGAIILIGGVIIIMLLVPNKKETTTTEDYVYADNKMNKIRMEADAVNTKCDDLERSVYSTIDHSRTEAQNNWNEHDRSIIKLQEDVAELKEQIKPIIVQHIKDEALREARGK